MFLSLVTADSDGTIEASGSQAEGWCIGMAEGSTNYSHTISNADNVGTTVCRSKASATDIIDLEDADAGSTYNQVATASASMGTEKFTLNYSVVDASSQRKGFYLAFGTASGGGGGAAVRSLINGGLVNRGLINSGLIG